MKKITKRLEVKRFGTLQEIKDFLNERDEENHFEIENEEDNIILFDGPAYASAFIGVTLDRRAIYDYNLMLKDYSGKDPLDPSLSEKAIEHMDEANDFISYNTLRYLDMFPEDKRLPIVINLN